MNPRQAEASRGWWASLNPEERQRHVERLRSTAGNGGPARSHRKPRQSPDVRYRKGI